MVLSLPSDIHVSKVKRQLVEIRENPNGRSMGVYRTTRTACTKQKLDKKDLAHDPP